MKQQRPEITDAKEKEFLSFFETIKATKEPVKRTAQPKKPINLDNFFKKPKREEHVVNSDIRDIFGGGGETEGGSVNQRRVGTIEDSEDEEEDGRILF